jgi:hypothetical membrane protein
MIVIVISLGILTFFAAFFCIAGDVMLMMLIVISVIQQDSVGEPELGAAREVLDSVVIHGGQFGLN